MEEWTTYALANFVPFTAEVYLRLIERVNAAWWPMHLATMAIGMGALALALTGRRRFVGPLLALLWMWTAYGFLQQFYADLNWAGTWFARAFYLQAVLLGFLMPFVCRTSGAPPVPVWPGLLLAGLGLVWPLVSMIGRNNLQQLEVVGIHPEPTTIFTLGTILLAFKGRWLWVLLPVPLLWCLISGLSLLVLELFPAMLLLAAAAVTFMGIFRKTGEDK